MKKITVLSVALLAVGLAAFAETETSATIENVVVRQRWPWKGVVDIDFTVRGKATGVKFVATYDGVEPFTLAEKDLSGEFAEILEPGVHSVTWNPEKAGLDKTELKNFSVLVEPEDKIKDYEEEEIREKYEEFSRDELIEMLMKDRKPQYNPRKEV